MAKTGSVTVKSKQGNYEGVPKVRVWLALVEDGSVRFLRHAL